MANAHLHNHDTVQSPAERELDDILNTVANCHDNMLVDLDNLIREVENIGAISVFELSPRMCKRVISYDTCVTLLHDLHNAFEFCDKIRYEMTPTLVAARRKARTSLMLAPENEIDALNSPQQVQQMINDSRQLNFWRRVACDRAKVAKPPRDRSGRYHAEIATQLLTECTNECIPAGKKHMDTLTGVQAIMDKVISLLDPIVRIRRYSTDRSLPRVHHVIDGLLNTITTCQNVMDRYWKAIEALDSIADSVAAERDLP